MFFPQRSGGARTALGPHRQRRRAYLRYSACRKKKLAVRVPHEGRGLDGTFETVQAIHMSGSMRRLLDVQDL